MILRQLVLGVALAVSFLGASPLAQARVGAPYSLDSLRPYLERGYITRLGWEGWPITPEDPHLYLYNRQTLARQAELEFGLQNGQIVSQTLKLALSQAELDPFAQAEINSFLREASQSQLSINTIRPILERNCPGHWQLAKGWVVSYYRENRLLFLHVSQGSATQAKALNQCQSRKTK